MKYICIALIRFYRKFLSPLKSKPCCRFTPTCSAYALEAYMKRGFFVGTALTVTRILRCNPFCAGGYDPVPLHGWRKKTGGKDRENVYDGESSEKFVFEYEFPRDDRREKSKKRKNK